MARSAADGAPEEAMSELEKKLVDRAYCPKNRFLLLHSKSKAWFRAWRTSGSAKMARRVLKAKHCMPWESLCGMLSVRIRPALTAGPV